MDKFKHLIKEIIKDDKESFIEHIYDVGNYNKNEEISLNYNHIREKMRSKLFKTIDPDIFLDNLTLNDFKVIHQYNIKGIWI